MPKNIQKLKPSVNREWKRSILDIRAPYNPLLVYNIQTKPTCAVFEGGGVKGIAYVGALEKLHEQDMLSGLEYVAGSSAGGITAFLLGIGHSPDQVKRIMDEDVDFEAFVTDGDKKWWDPAGIVNKFNSLHKLISKDTHGLVSGDNYTNLIEKLLVDQMKKKFEEKFGPENALDELKKYFPKAKNNQSFEDIAKNMRFTEFNAIRKANHPEFGFIDMKFTGTNLTQKDGVIFGSGEHAREKNFRIVDAVRITGSFPGMFAAVPVKNPNTGVVDLYVDGGLCNNFPSQIFDDEVYLPVGHKATRNLANPGMIGFLVDSKEEIESKIWHKSVKSKAKKSSLLSYLGSLISGMQINTAAIEKHDTRIIQIYDKGISTLKFDINEEETEQLIQSGRNAASAWINNYRSEPILDFDYHTDLHAKYIGLTNDEYLDCANMLFEAYEGLEDKSAKIEQRPNIIELRSLLKTAGLEEDILSFTNKRALARILKRANPKNKLKLKQDLDNIRNLFERKPSLYANINSLGIIEERLSQINNEFNAICDHCTIDTLNEVGIRLLDDRKKNILKIINKVSEHHILVRKTRLERKKSTMHSKLHAVPEEETEDFVKKLQNLLKKSKYVNCQNILSKYKANLKNLEKIIRINGGIMKLHREHKMTLKRETKFLSHKIEAIKTIKKYDIEHEKKRKKMKKTFANIPELDLKRKLSVLDKTYKTKKNKLRDSLYKLKKESYGKDTLGKDEKNDIKKDLNLLSAFEMEKRQLVSIDLDQVKSNLELELRTKKTRIETIDQQLSSLTKENENIINKKYMFKKQIGMYNTAADFENLRVMRRLIDINSKLTEYIDKKSNKLTRFLEYFSTNIIKTDTALFPGKAYLIHKAKQQQHQLQEVLKDIQENWSASSIDKYEQHFNVYKNVLTDDLSAYKTIFWGDSHKELMQILTEHERSNEYFDQSELVFVDPTKLSSN